MRAFAELIDRLLLTPGRIGKIELLRRYFETTPDPDRGWGLAALAGALSFQTVKPALLRSLVEERVDPVLFALSYDYVGDLAETVSLIWPASEGQENVALSDVVERLRASGRTEARHVVASLLDRLGANERYALIKLVTGGLRIGAGARLAKQALADWGQTPVGEIEQLWHGLSPPYLDLFAWLEKKSPKPVSAMRAPFRPIMLAHALEEADRVKLNAADYAAEWKWDGVRAQAVSEAGVRRLYSRAGEDITAAFPDVVEAMEYEGALDGELLVKSHDGAPAPFNDLQQRLNRKTVDRKMLERFPAFIRAYDLLVDGESDLRSLPFRERRQRLERFVWRLASPRIDLSPLVGAEDWDALSAARAHANEPAIEGLMLKRWDSVYEAGRPKGLWFKWKRDPFTADCVLMYAQRGHGKRSSYYSDYTFGVWSDDGALTPVGKAYFGFTDEELRLLDKFVREHTVERFGPVRAVRAERAFGLVLEIAFEGLARSNRHRSGLAMRFPRVKRIRWDKPAAEADTLGTLEALLR